MKLSEEQKVGIEIASTGRSFVVVAGAGCGKSTLLRLIAERSPTKHFVYIVFNRKNRDEAKEKMPANVTVTTANSMAYHQTVPSQCRDKVQPDLSHHYIINATDPRLYKDVPYEEAVATGILAKTIINNFLRSTENKVSTVHLPESMKKSKARKVERAIEMARRYWSRASRFECDITHDVYMKLWFLARQEIACDAILYDEAQDASPIMISAIGRQECQKIIVGDPYQQLYAFLGAQDALEKMGIEEKVTLSQSFRYGTRIADLANKLIESAYGVTTNLKGWEEHGTVISENAGASGPETVIARTNGELVRMALDNRSDDFSLLIRSQEIKSIARSIYAINNGLEPDHPSLIGVESMKELMLLARSNESSGLMGWVSSYMKHGYGSMMELAEKCVDTYHGQSKTLYISGHRSKGLEFDNVELARDFPQPKSAEGKPNNRFNEDEVNLQYVAITRAIKHLNLGGNEFLSRLAGITWEDNQQQELFA